MSYNPSNHETLVTFLATYVNMSYNTSEHETFQSTCWIHSVNITDFASTVSMYVELI